MTVSTLVVEDGSIVEDSNSYSDLADFKQYIEDRLHTDDYEDESDDNLTRGLLLSFKILNKDICWYGYPAERTQKNAFPRAGLALYSREEIPPAVIEAQYEIALHVLGDDFINAGGSSAVNFIRAGSVAISSNSNLSADSLIPDIVYTILRGLAERSEPQILL